MWSKSFYLAINLIKLQYECYSAPLQFDGIEYSWWNDRNGNEQYYWHGSDNSTHMCSCGISKTCVDPSKNCNCDAIVPVDLVDEGNIGKQNRIYFIERVSNIFWILNRWDNCEGKFAHYTFEFRKNDPW
jgi:contactin associated protein 1